MDKTELILNIIEIAIKMIIKFLPKIIMLIIAIGCIIKEKVNRRNLNDSTTKES